MSFTLLFKPCLKGEGKHENDAWGWFSHSEPPRTCTHARTETEIVCPFSLIAQPSIETAHLICALAVAGSFVKK